MWVFKAHDVQYAIKTCLGIPKQNRSSRSCRDMCAGVWVNNGSVFHFKLEQAAVRTLWQSVYDAKEMHLLNSYT